MHIVDITLFFAPHSGGVKRYLLAKHRHYAARADVRHSLLVPGCETRQIESGVFAQASFRIPGGGGYRLPLRPARWRRAIEALRPDVIEVGDPYHLAWAALDAARTTGALTAAFCHSDLPRMLSCRFGRYAGRAADAYLRKLYANFDLVQAPSRLIAQRLRASGIERIVVQPLGVDGDLFHPSRRDRALRGELGLPDAARVLIFAGRMAHEKRIALLLEAVAKLGAPYHLLLVGGAARRRLSATATLLPYEQDSLRLARLLASADVLVHAGAQETFGMIAIEAMACGLPVVGVRGGALPELIDDSVGALAEVDDAPALCAAIEKVYSGDLSRLGLAARARIEQRYTWTRTFDLQFARYARGLRMRGSAAAAAQAALASADASGTP